MQHLLAGSRESLTKKASYLRIASGIIAESMKSGGFRSLYRGQGVEISGVREYLRGDDVRTIDWNVTARMSKPFVKVFEEERELQMFIIVDRSASMFTGSKGKVKYESAAEAAAVLAISAELNESPVGAVFFDGNITFSSLPASGPLQTMKLLTKLDEIEKIEKGSALDNAIKGAEKMLKRHSLVFVISDFRSAGWEDSFKLLAQKNDVTAVRIADQSEFEIPEIGSIPFTDTETGMRTIFPTNSRSFRSAWKDDFRQRTNRLSDFCRRHGAGFVSIATDEDVVRILSRYFMAKGQAKK